MHNTENNSPFAHTLAALICEETYEDLIAGFAKQDIGIEVLDLPVRQYNLLNTSGIHTMSQLLKMTRKNAMGGAKNALWSYVSSGRPVIRR